MISHEADCVITTGFSLLPINSCLMLKRRKRGVFCPTKIVRRLFGFVKEGISVAGSLGFISVGSGYEFAKKKLQGAAHIALFASAGDFSATTRDSEPLKSFNK